MISGVSWMDLEWWKTSRFIYGKVLGSFGKFRVKPRKVYNILEGGGTGPAGPGPPRRAAPGLADQAKPSGGGSPSLPPCELERERSPSSPLLPVCSLSVPIWQIGV